MASSNTLVIYAALAGDLAVAITKFVAAGLTGSSSMLSEGVHSLVDSSTQVVLLYGQHRARRQPDRGHPFGHGREVYFWSFIVSLLIFALGAGVSGYEGIVHIVKPTEIESFRVNYVVLALSFLFDGASWIVAFREFNRARGDRGFLEAARRSKDPTGFMTLFEDSASVIGVAIAALGSLAVQLTGLAWLDGMASVLIAVLLGMTGLFLARESKGLLLGEQADEGLMASILDLTREQPSIDDANGLYTVQMAPDQILAALSLEFEDGLTTQDIERTVERLETSIRARHPDVVALFVKPQTRGTFERLRGERLAAAAERAGEAPLPDVAPSPGI